jgi:hypothetical protein
VVEATSFAAVAKSAKGLPAMGPECSDVYDLDRWRPRACCMLLRPA